MAGHGRRFDFHGAFKSKEKAKRKEKQVGGFIKAIKVHGKTRYSVMTRKS